MPATSTPHSSAHGSGSGIIRRRSRAKKRRRTGVATKIRIGSPTKNFEVPDGMTNVAERRGMERFDESTAMDLPIRTAVAMVYLQGIMDAADVIGDD